MKILLIVEIISIVIATILRLWHAGKMNIVGEVNDGSVILVAGMFNQADSAFNLLRLPNRHYVYANFSNLGFDAASAGKQLLRLIKDNPIYGISIGAKVSAYAEAEKAIWINPCIDPKTLKGNLYWPIKIGAPILEAVSCLLGVIAFLPIIPTGIAGNYSIALLADQLFCIGYGSPTVAPSDTKAIILSSQDEFLDNGKVVEICGCNQCYVIIDTMHGRTADPAVSEWYSRAIENLLDKIPSL
ncbi:hypothetical protein IJI55_01720 [Candidatus Saccharibacteria bacterium]|nr:hypothetical protein [Candidatus Saccharibacteria bacterium]